MEKYSMRKARIEDAEEYNKMIGVMEDYRTWLLGSGRKSTHTQYMILHVDEYILYLGGLKNKCLKKV